MEPKAEHLEKLADAFFKNLIVDYTDEFGSIGLHGKKPFGNSGVVADIFEIIGMKPEFNCPDCRGHYSQEQYEYAMELYFDHLIPYLNQEWNSRR